MKRSTPETLNVHYLRWRAKREGTPRDLDAERLRKRQKTAATRSEGTREGGMRRRMKRSVAWRPADRARHERITRSRVYLALIDAAIARARGGS